MHISQSCSLLLIFTLCITAQNVLLTNDDGWAVAQIRAQNTALINAGFNVRIKSSFVRRHSLTSVVLAQVVLSAPAENESGTSSKTATPTVLNETCEFDTCPVGSPPEGSDSSNRQFPSEFHRDPYLLVLGCGPSLPPARLNYVNSFPLVYLITFKSNQVELIH